MPKRVSFYSKITFTERNFTDMDGYLAHILGIGANPV